MKGELPLQAAEGAANKKLHEARLRNAHQGADRNRRHNLRFLQTCRFFHLAK